MFGSNNKKPELTISNNTIIRLIGFGLLTVLIVRFFESIIHPLTLVFVSFFLAIALNQAVNFVSDKLKNRSRTGATAIAYVAVMSILIGFFALVVPPLVNQTREFINEVPQTIRDTKENEGLVGDLVRRYELEEQVTTLANNWARDFSGGQAVSIANRVVSNIISIVVVLVLTFMMLIEGPKWVAAFWKQYPKNKRAHARKIVDRMYAVVTNYVNGQVVVAGIGASFSIVALFIASAVFKADAINPIALGGIVFLFSLIPMFGASIAAIIVVLVSLVSSPALALVIAIYFILYQQIENTTIQPYIQSRGNELTPMLVFIAAIIGAGFGGLLGALVAIPVAGCVRILVDDYLTSKVEATKS